MAIIACKGRLADEITLVFIDKTAKSRSIGRGGFVEVGAGVEDAGFDPADVHGIEAEDLARHMQELAGAVASHGAERQPLSSPGLMEPPKEEPAVAQEQENVAKIEESKARLTEAEAEVPKAIAEAFRLGSLGIMDFYKLRNVQADTDMCQAIATSSGGTTSQAG